MLNLPRPQAKKTAVAPSILSADQMQLGAQIALAKSGGADWLHVDIMDGSFVPNLTFGPATVKWIAAQAGLAQDVHLMVLRPGDFIAPFASAGASALTLHIESQGDIKALLGQIKSLGMAAGLSIKPGTNPSALLPFIDLLDLVLVMTVEPGFASQKFLANGPAQIAGVRELINKSGRDIWLEVDGGINAQTAQIAVQAGANALVAGNAIFNTQDIAAATRAIKQAANSF